MQHREWNPKAFFRKLTAEVLKRFALEHGLALKNDEVSKPDAAYVAWLGLPGASRLALSDKLLPVNDLCLIHARGYLEDAARLLWKGDLRLASMGEWTVQDLAMRVFLESPTAIKECHQRFAIDNLDHFIEYRGAEPKRVKATPQTKRAMADLMRRYFHEQAGGSRCQVEDYEGPDKFAIVVFHESEVTPVDRFNQDNQVVAQWERPVAQMAAVFYPETCTLHVKASKRESREKLRDAFAELFVGQADYFAANAESSLFDFRPLQAQDFAFPTRAKDAVQEVCVTRLTLRHPDGDLKQLTIELVPGLSMEGVAGVLRRRNLRLETIAIAGLRLQFVFGNVKGPAARRTVSLFNPGSTNLRDTPRDRLIRGYLAEWGIDARASRHPMVRSSHKPAAGS